MTTTDYVLLEGAIRVHVFIESYINFSNSTYIKKTVVLELATSVNTSLLTELAHIE